MTNQVIPAQGHGGKAMSDEYYAAMREAIFWQSMWKVVPLSIFAGLLAGFISWLGFQKKKQCDNEGEI